MQPLNRGALDQAMIAAGLSMLANSGPRPFHMGPPSFGQALGQGGLAGFGTYLQAAQPADRKIIKGADGYNYYQDTGERVLPGVKKPVERKTLQDAQGVNRWTDTGAPVFGDSDKPAPKTPDPWEIRKIERDEELVSEQWNPKTMNWEPYAKAPRWQPQKPAAPPTSAEERMLAQMSELEVKERDGTLTENEAVHLDNLRENTRMRARTAEALNYGRPSAALVNELRTNIDEMTRGIELIQHISTVDDSALGVLGTVRRGVSNLIGIGGDVASVFPGFDATVNEAKKIIDEQVKLGMPEEDAYGYLDDPRVATITQLENSLGLIYARARYGATGRLPVDLIRTSIKDMQLTGGQSAEKVRAKLKLVEDTLRLRAAADAHRLKVLQQGAELAGAGAASAAPGGAAGPAGQAPPPGAPGYMPEWEMINGRLRQVR